MIVRGAARPRRPPPQGSAPDRYRGLARNARTRHPFSANARIGVAVAGVVMLALAAFVSVRTAAVFGSAFDSLSRDISTAVGTALAPDAPADLRIEPVTGNVQAAPVIDQLPTHTSLQSVLLQGHLPSFALGPGRELEVSLNGKVIGVATPDAAGRFSQALTLADGENAVVISVLHDGAAIASRSALVVLDRKVPPLAISRPRAGESIAGQTITVVGLAEPDARVTVNGRLVVVATNGSFNESFTATSGPLTIEVIARDQAGNETKSSVGVTVAGSGVAPVGRSVSLSLNRTEAIPGGPVIAEVSVLEGGRLKDGVVVTLQVGVVTIGTAKTDANGRALISFAAPTTEGEITVVALTSGASARATITVAK